MDHRLSHRHPPRNSEGQRPDARCNQALSGLAASVARDRAANGPNGRVQVWGKIHSKHALPQIVLSMPQGSYRQGFIDGCAAGALTVFAALIVALVLIIR